jgi:glycosyltransferase involved in cell wall biosynthesis
METISSIGIIVPSRHDADQEARLERALYTIFNQEIPEEIKVTTYLGLDPGAMVPECISTTVGAVIPVFADQCSQAAALNACIRATQEDLVMFLEDDDFWEPGYVQLVLAVYASGQGVEMTTSNQLEIDEYGEPVRVNDFATPSSWSITRRALTRVGFFNEDYHYHLDNAFLGAAAVQAVIRLHLLERTAPLDAKAASSVRPWIHNIMALSGETTYLSRHSKDSPYIIRVVRNASRSSEMINEEARAQSQLEYQRLQQEFGRIPW